ncbi:hypothetical protein CYY_000974 [Polysphondylium violaceum]|uniref:Ankyrin repeat-containing protein n=1 Tax=Polysphondylium violaceum TaxID=133409 RepID=A0A8J4Q3W2_9MYCE|nr:hypothetical protein CYY_000974 [Polysphondylium violaceum]
MNTLQEPQIPLLFQPPLYKSTTSTTTTMTSASSLQQHQQPKQQQKQIQSQLTTPQIQQQPIQQQQQQIKTINLRDQIILQVFRNSYLLKIINRFIKYSCCELKHVHIKNNVNKSNKNKSCNNSSGSNSNSNNSDNNNYTKERDAKRVKFIEFHHKKESEDRWYRPRPNSRIVSSSNFLMGRGTSSGTTGSGGSSITSTGNGSSGGGSSFLLNGHRHGQSKRYLDIMDARWMCDNGYINLLEYKFKRNEVIYGWDSHVIEVLCTHQRYFDMVKYLFKHHTSSFLSSSIETAGFHGNIKVIQFLHEHQLSYDPSRLILCLVAGTEKFTKPNYKQGIDYVLSVNQWPTPSINLQKSIEEAAFLGNFELVKMFLNMNQGDVTRLALENAMSQGHIEIVKYLYPLTINNNNITFITLDSAAENGHIEIIQYISKQIKDKQSSTSFKRNLFNNIAFELAIINQHFEIVKFISQDSNFEYSSKFAVDEASNNGDLDILVYLISNLCLHGSTNAIDFAAANGHLQVIKFLVSKKYTGTKSAINIASEKGHLEVVKYLMQLKFQLTSYAGEWAAANGHFEIVKHIYETELYKSESFLSSKKELSPMFLIGNSTTNHAAAEGHFEIVEYLFNRGIVGTNLAIDQASANGHLEIVKLLSEQLKPSSIEKAIERGYIEIVKWFHQQSLINPALSSLFSSKSIDIAAKNGFLNIVEFLHTNRTESCTEEAFKLAARNGHYDVVVYLYHNFHSIELTCSIMDLACTGHFRIMEFLHNIGAPCSTKAMIYASSNGHLDIIQFLHKNRSEGCTHDAMDQAASGNQLHVVEWLYENRKEGCSKIALEKSVRCNHISVVKFLLDKYVLNPIDLETRAPQLYPFLIQGSPERVNFIKTLYGFARSRNFLEIQLLFDQHFSSILSSA